MFDKPAGIPRQSGCYLFRNAQGVIIYVGKALSLNQRLSSYFQRSDAMTAKTQALMAEAASVEWIITPNEIDALILENELIKDNQPRYNMRLKDDKSFPYVAIDTRVDYPAPVVTRSHHVKGVRYFGPFVEVRALRATIEELLQAFPLRSCTKHKFNYHERIGRPCLLYDIGKCSGPCVQAVTKEGYQELVQSWARFFEGDVRQLRQLLTNQMEAASALKHYEAAAKARDALAALDRAAAGEQSVVLDDHSNLDVLAVATDGGRAAVVRFRVRFGRIIGRTIHLIDRSMDESDAEILESLLPELYATPDDVAPVVVVASDESASDLMRQYLTTLRAKPVDVVAPQRGRRRRVLELAKNDAVSVIGRDSLRRQSDHNVRSRALQEIGQALGLAQPPYRIECFDMSHLQGTNYVGSMVVFEDGLAKKSDYRHFNVKEVLGNDDVGAMEEVVRRRLSHWSDESSGSKFRHPDLIIDGGLPQLHAAQKAAASLGLDQVEFTALAKREELLYRPGTSVPVVLERGSESLYLVQRVRDEAHRFAIATHRAGRSRALVTSELDEIAGIGPGRKRALLNHFGSARGVGQAGLHDLEAAPGISRQIARVVYAHFHPGARVEGAA